MPYRTAKEAEPARAQLEMELRLGSASGARRRAFRDWTLEELVEAYAAEVLVPGRRAESTIRTQRTYLASAVRWLGPSQPAGALTTPQVEAAVARRRQEPKTVNTRWGRSRPGAKPVSDTTVHGEIRAIRTVLNWAIAGRKLEDPDRPGEPMKAIPWRVRPSEKLRPKTHRSDLRMDAPTMVRLAEGIEPDREPIDLAVLLWMVGGMRGEDVLALSWEDWQAPCWMASSHKTENPGPWPMPPAVAAYLSRIAGKGRLFETPPIWQQISRRARKLCGRLVGVKAYRHTFEGGLKAGGVPHAWQKQLMGHKLVDVTDGYGPGTLEELQGALLVLPWVPVIEARAKEWGPRLRLAERLTGA